ncbi:MAG: exosortase C-terminal domain/associated protein EpsI [Thermogemmata sp.]|uniref:EpsI family protein n=1 Tax=Thermogemmata fonticola TaxID=2755323 RepID=A0A7V9ABC2_9BACT|nr:exosortase C-terminal domain/associated protein EpsI [Thermogemmata fonticola]MBA2225878.1 EpsI family protein [Thermogemmata fonticola]
MRIPATTACVLLLTVAIPWWLAPWIRYWGIQAEYADRWLILLVAAVIAWQRYAQGIPAELSSSRFLSSVLLLSGGLLFPLGVFLQAQVTPRPLLLWWLFVSWQTLVVGTLLRLGGLPLLRHFAFPLAFLLFALPLPNRLQLPLQFGLQHGTTGLAAFVLDALGWNVQRDGFILHLPHCDLNVVEACSGVRSVTAMLAVATFLAYLHHLSLRRGLILLLLTLPLIALINAVRVIASGILCECWGPASIQGWRHQGLGLFMVIIGFGLLYALTRFLQPRPRSVVSLSPATPSLSPFPLSQTLRHDAALRSQLDTLRGLPIPTAGQFTSGIHMVLTILGVITFATLLASWLGRQQQAEVQAEAPLEQLPLHFADFTGQDLPIPEPIREMLTPDQILHRAYCDSLGHTWEVWIIFWSSPAMVKGYHHPDICWPNRGFTCLDRRPISLPLPSGQLTVTERLFARDTQRYMIWYWTQEGQQVWSEADERRVQLLGNSHEWVLERLWYQRQSQVRGRLSVWVGTPLWGQRPLLEAVSYEFLSQLAVHLYQLCPWAYPTSP